MSDNVIPINIGTINALKRIIEALKDTPWSGPKTFNAILIDRAGMYKTVQVSNPPPTAYRLAVKPKRAKAFWTPDEIPDSITFESRDFEFYRRIGDTLEYREF